MAGRNLHTVIVGLCLVQLVVLISAQKSCKLWTGNIVLETITNCDPLVLLVSGLPCQSDYARRSGRIVGGMDALRGSTPYIASLTRR